MHKLVILVQARMNKYPWLLAAVFLLVSIKFTRRASGAEATILQAIIESFINTNKIESKKT